MITLAAQWTDRQWTLLGWAVLGLAVAIALAVSMLPNGRVPGPGALFKRISANMPGRIVLVLGWMWLGWHLFAR